MSGDSGPPALPDLSRRQAVAYGALAATGGVAGSSDLIPSPGSSRPESSRSATVAGGMLPYQFVPGSRAELVATDLDWHPGSLDPTIRTHVIRYSRSRSLRAYVFTDRELPRRTGAVTLEREPDSRVASADVIGVDLRFDE